MGNTPSKPEAPYRVTVKTSWDYKGAGTHGSVHLEMIGEDDERTGLKVLNDIFQHNFEVGKTDVFDLRLKDVGLPVGLRIKVGKDRLACRDIVVNYRNEVATYPVYDWIEKDKDITVMKAKALTFVQAKGSTQLRRLRESEVIQNKLRFPWVPRATEGNIGWGLPCYVKKEGGKLPSIFVMTFTREKNLAVTGFQDVYNAARVALEGILHSLTLDTLESYCSLYKYLKNDDHPALYSRWEYDEEFGYQQVNGVSPTSYRRCKQIPEGCQVTNAHVAQEGIGCSLDEEIKAGKVYIADYSKVFQDVPRNKSGNGDQLYCPDAFCLYRVDAEDRFVPIAIQLVPNDEETIFTPNDSKYDWQLAKMYFKVAMGNLHQWHYHFLLTHNVMEPFAVSMFRCLPRCHPLYKLLRPHLQSVTVINDAARSHLIPPDSKANQAIAIEADAMARKMFKDFTFEDLVIPKVLKKRGLDDPKLLPKNYYRDDSLELWKIIGDFVGNVIKNYYHCDEDVAADEEVQDFASDVAREGFAWQDGNARGCPESISSVKQLVDICTCIIFTCSVQHAGVNFGQYETYKFIPHAPMAMRLPPHKRGEATMERILNSLPDEKMSATIILLTYLLSSYSPDEIYIGNYPDELFKETEVTILMNKYKEELREFSTKVKARNAFAASPYEWLLPEKIPNSIAI